jgi:hypothetical protein
VWLKDYKEKYAHPFFRRNELVLPAGTWIRGIPEGASIWLIPPDTAAPGPTAQTPNRSARAE